MSTLRLMRLQRGQVHLEKLNSSFAYVCQLQLSGKEQGVKAMPRPINGPDA